MEGADLMNIPQALTLLTAAAALTTLATEAGGAAWAPAPGPLMTRWAKEVSPNDPLPDYPRPQLVRSRWRNLNGLWEYGITTRDQEVMPEPRGQILVPFPIESALSGVGARVDEGSRLWYRRAFTLPVGWRKDRLLLHFGAVDWQAEVFVNGRPVGSHRGGYDPFTLDITEALKPGATQELMVAVWDPTDAGAQPRGKQIRKPEGIWYTPTTGIWQTVWLEPVPQTSLQNVKVTPDLDSNTVRISAVALGEVEGCRLMASAGGQEATAEFLGGSATVTLKLKNPKLWSPESPHLYDLRLALTRDGKAIDRVKSYFGMRKVALGKDSEGITRIFLNNQPQFMLGLLDQGFWPDGLYTAPTDAALRYDIEVTKQLGFNMARKHVKVEPSRWYYWCDRLGLLVWQDMPSGDQYIGPRDPDPQRTPESAAQFEAELKALMDGLHNHPSIVMWVPFNEGWGQYDTARIAKWTHEYDPTRLVNCPSGWTDRGVGDVHDLHIYPGPGSPDPTPVRAAVLGEYGGLGLPLEGHTWQGKDNWGYRSYTDRQQLTDAYLQLQQNLHPLLGEPGLSAAVYTQTTDVEIEVNGLLTYDRAVIKIDPNVVAEANQRLFTPPPRHVTLLATSEKEPQTWRYTLETPAPEWTRRAFDDSGWKEAPGGFGTAGTPGAIVRTPWNTNDIWLRRTFTLVEDVLVRPQLLIHHDEDVEVYLNGVKAASLSGYTTNYVLAPISAEALAVLKPGQNTLAVHCKQTTGGQYIDVGLRDEQPARSAPVPTPASRAGKRRGR